MSEIQTFTFPDLSLKSKTSFSPESLLYLVKIVEFFKTFRNPESRHLPMVLTIIFVIVTNQWINPYPIKVRIGNVALIFMNEYEEEKSED